MPCLAMWCGLTVVAGFPNTGYADSWSLTRQGQFDVSYDDNVRMAPTRPVGSANGAAQVSARLLYQRAGVLCQIEPRLAALRYNAEPILNHTEQYLSALIRNGGERGEVSLALSAVRDTTLTSEPGLTGLAEVNKPHRSLAASVLINRDVSERLHLSAQLSASGNIYLDAGNTGLVDYRYGLGSITARYGMSERSAVSLTATRGRLQVPESALFDKHNESLALAYDREITPQWRMHLSAGPARTTDRGGVDAGSVYAVSVLRSGERASVTASATREDAATGRGILNRRDELRVSASKSWSERWEAALGVTLVRQNEVLPQVGSARSQVSYGEVSASLSGRITPRWRLVLSAAYSQQRDGTVSPLVARRGRVGVGVRWSSPDRAGILTY